MTLEVTDPREEPSVYCHKGSRTWKNRAKKQGRLTSHEIASFIQNITQFIMRVKKNHISKLHMALTCFSLEVHKG